MQRRRRSVKLRTEAVSKGMKRAVFEVSVRIRKVSRIRLNEAIECCMKFEVVKISRDRSQLTVVVDLSVIEHGMTDAKIKYRGVAAAASRTFDRRDIRYAILVDKYLY